MSKTNSGFLLIVAFLVVVLGGYLFFLLQYSKHYEKRAMPANLQTFKEMGERVAAFYKAKGRFPSTEQEIDVISKALLSDSTSGISIDYPNQRIRYNFERDDFDLYGSPLHVFSLGLIPADRNLAIEYDIITIKNMAQKN